MKIHALTITIASLTLALTATACDPDPDFGDALLDDPELATLDVDSITPSIPHELPGEQFGDPNEAPEVIEAPEAPEAPEAFIGDRVTYVAEKNQRGTTVNIPVDVIEDLCGDLDGCTLRMGMYDWDGAQRVASRDNLVYYNVGNRAWRTSEDDEEGENNNGTTEHLMKEWACYFTDGHYSNWFNFGDNTDDFGLLAWNQYTAACRLTIID